MQAYPFYYEIRDVQINPASKRSVSSRGGACVVHGSCIFLDHCHEIKGYFPQFQDAGSSQMSRELSWCPGTRM